MALNIFKLGLSKISNISLGLVILLIQLFMFINTKLFFPENTAYWHDIILTYLVVVAVFFALPDFRSKMFNVRFIDAIKSYFLSFVITLVFLGLIAGILSLTDIFKINWSSIPLGIIFLQVFVVAVIEELIFRDTMPKLVGVVTANILFAVFHWQVYQGNYLSLVIAFIAGLMFTYLRMKSPNPEGNELNIGAHAGINLYLYGIWQTILKGVNI